MKKLLLVILSLVLISGCTKEVQENRIESPKIEKVEGDAYSTLSDLLDKEANHKSFSVGVISRYEFLYKDGSKDTFSMDEVMQSDENIHLEQNINSNGLVSNLDGYYYDGKLFSKYNGITFYEEMDKTDIKKTLLFPIDPFMFKEEDIDKIEMGNDEDNYLSFLIKLNNDKALDIFLSRYDIYGVENFGDVKVKDNQVIYRFDDEEFVRETSTFVLETVMNNEPININFSLNVNYFFVDETTVEVSEELKKEHQEYVHYQNIDVESISAKVDDESADTIRDTFKNRLVSRLGYEEVEDREGVYRSSFNENEIYTIDFNNNTFMYTNYSIDYTYNWKGDVGSMGNCTFNYKNESQASECNETTIKTLKDIKSYLEMELYYCGLTYNELISE